MRLVCLFVSNYKNRLTYNIFPRIKTDKMAAPDGMNTDWILVSDSQTDKLNAYKSDANLVSKRWRIERSNLLNIAKICIKTLIDSSLSAGNGRVLTEDFPILEQFFTVLEHILRHGLKVKRSLLGPRKEFIGVLEVLEKKINSLPDILTNIRNLSDIKTNIGRTRAWMRLALMQKVLAEQMLSIVEERDLLSDWYEENSVMKCEEGGVIAGMLVGLNVIDCNFHLKGNDIDNYNGIIDISLYLKDGNYLDKTLEENVPQKVDQKIEMILDQKAYLEQLNKSLNDSVSELKLKAQHKKDKEDSAENEVEELRNRLVSVIAEKEKHKKDYELLLQEHSNRLQNVNADLDTERETYNQSRSGLNDMYLEATKKLEQETQERKELQIIAEEQKAMNDEKQIAMQLLEKDIIDKQDTLISLRRQLEDIKKLNLEMHNKWQSSDASLKKQMAEWSSMEQNCSRMIIQTKEMEKRLSIAESQKKSSEEIAHQIGAKLAKVQTERKTFETDLTVEREWRVGLQAELEEEKLKNGTQAKELTKSTNHAKENAELKARLEKAEARILEQDIALMEMGNQLNKTHVKVDEMKELQATLKESQWLDDKDAVECQSCNQSFSLARRKHHCRNCGGIFCNNCSDNTMPLASSAKPVRVCDCCHQSLLERYSSGAS